MVWECQPVLLPVQASDGLAGATLHRLEARDVRDADGVKFVVSRAAPATGAATLLRGRLLAMARGAEP